MTSVALEAFDFGCILSICFSSFVIITYLARRERRRHPATLIASRSVCDLCLGAIWLASSLKTELDCSSAEGRANAFFIEFFVIASESLFACVCLDVLIHAGDPFTDYRSNLSLYFTSVIVVSLLFSIGLVHNADAHVGESFLPLCWTKYGGGRVISDANVPMSLFFYIPWSIIFLLSIAALARACVILGDIGVEGSSGAARASALRDTRRVIFAHAAYWGAVLMFFAPMTNSMDNADEFPHGTVSSIVKFLSGARAIENAMVWVPSLSTSKKSRRHLGGDADLSPLLNTEMQRDVLVAAVVGMTTLLREDDSAQPLGDSNLIINGRTSSVRLGTWRQGSVVGGSLPSSSDEALDQPLLDSSIVDDDEVLAEAYSNDKLRRELIFLVISVGPILIACLAAGLAAILDKSEPTYLCIVFFGASAAILFVLVVSWELARRQIKRFTVAEFTVLHSKEFQELRQLWTVSADFIAVSLLEAIRKDARFAISPGRSGAFMFFSPDNRFVVKTIKSQEARTLGEVILPRLIEYCRDDCKGGFTSLARVFACFEMTCFGRLITLVVMENVTGNLGAGDTKYDLKGSWYARSTDRPKQGKVYICEACGRPFVHGSRARSQCLLNRNGHTPKRLLKDNDFRERVLGSAVQITELRERIKKDVDFLASCGVMDYSLLLCVRRRVMHLTAAHGESEWFPSHRLLLAALIEGPSAFQFGIIDWFTQYDNSKRLEKFIKVNLLCRWERDIDGYLGVSAVDPAEYRDRFMARVINVVFPLLYDVVQLVDTARDEFAGDAALVCTTLDVSGVDSFPRLCQFVSQSSGTPLDLTKDKLFCSSGKGSGASSGQHVVEPFEVTEATFTEFRRLAAKSELTSLLVARGKAKGTL